MESVNVYGKRELSRGRPRIQLYCSNRIGILNALMRKLNNLIMKLNFYISLSTGAARIVARSKNDRRAAAAGGVKQKLSPLAPLAGRLVEGPINRRGPVSQQREH